MSTYNFHRYTLVLLLVATGTFACSVHQTHADYNASSLLGQINLGGTPDWFAYGANNNHQETNSQGFNQPDGAAVDATNHRLFVLDCGNNRVLVFPLDASNTVASTSPSYILGQNDFSLNNATTPTQNGLSCPNVGIAFDSQNSRLFVSDSGNNRVMVFNVATSSITNGENAETVLGQPDFLSDASSITQSGLNYPEGLAYDATASRLFVVDSGNNRVMVFDVSTSSINNGENAETVLGQPDFNIDITGGNGTTTQSGFAYPSDAVYDATVSRLFVVDSGNNRVMVFNVATSTIADGEDASYVIGQSDFATSNTSTPSQSGLSDPSGLAYDGSDTLLFVGDAGNSRVLSFNVATSTIANGENASNVLGQSDYVSGGVATTENGLNDPEGDIAYDSASSQLFVPDASNNRVMVFDVATSTIANGQNAITELGEYDSGGTVDYTKSDSDNGNPAAVNAVGFNQPHIPAIDLVNHRLFVPEYGNNRVLVFSLDANNDIATTTASYVLGQPDFTSTDASTSLNITGGNDHGVTYDPVNNRLFVADADNDRILVFNVAPGVISNGENASYVLGQGTSSQSTFQPYSVTYDDSNERLFVSDEGAPNRVLVFNVATSTIQNNENASYVLGEPDFVTSSGGDTTQSGMNDPAGMDYDSINSRLFVADFNNNRVLVFNVATSTIVNGENASYVLGQPDFISNSASETQGGFDGPNDVTYDPVNNRLFVADFFNARDLVFDAATSTIASGENASFVFGQSNYTSSDSFASQSSLGCVTGETLDPSRRQVYVADNCNNRVLEYKMIELTNGSLPSGAVGAAYGAPLRTVNAQGAVSFFLVSGSLPSGLDIDGSSISGVPTTQGNSTFTLEASDGLGSEGTLTDEETFTINIGTAPAPPPPTPPATTGPIVGVAASYGIPGYTGGASSVVPATPIASSSSTIISMSSLAAELASLQTEFSALMAQAEEGVGSPTLPVFSPSYVFTRNLFYGMTGSDVRELQLFLINQASGPAAAKLKAHGVTRTFGMLTFSALKEFQNKAGITPASGYFGPKTRASVNAAKQ